MAIFLEVCVNSVASALEAERGGADRVELCENMADGGCTPSTGTIMYAKQHMTIPVFVMIRPRSGDFCYSDDEFSVMKEDIRMAKELTADGVVFGILKRDGRIDQNRMHELTVLARPMGVTCHRAFDLTRDPFEALEDLISLGIDRVLTSGQSEHALKGAPLIHKLVLHAKGRVIVMPGGGIKEHNLSRVLTETGANEVHLYLTTPVRSRMEFTRTDVMMGHTGRSEYEYPLADAERIKRARLMVSKWMNER